MPTQLALHFRVELDSVYAALLALSPELADTAWREGDGRASRSWDTCSIQRPTTVSALCAPRSMAASLALTTLRTRGLPRTGTPANRGRPCSTGGR